MPQPYEFGTLPLVGEPEQVGGGLGNLAPGQWSDDTEMACVIAQVAAKGMDLRTPEALRAIAEGFLRWFADDPPDVGNQTRQVLGNSDPGSSVVREMTAVSRALFEQSGHAAGNGSLMRTGPAALAHLGDTEAIAAAAVMTDAASTIRALRSEDKTVLLHCVHAETRTPLVAAVYGASIAGGTVASALDRVLAVLPNASPRPSLRAIAEVMPTGLPELTDVTPGVQHLYRPDQREPDCDRIGEIDLNRAAAPGWANQHGDRRVPRLLRTDRAHPTDRVTLPRPALSDPPASVWLPEFLVKKAAPDDPPV